MSVKRMLNLKYERFDKKKGKSRYISHILRHVQSSCNFVKLCKKYYVLRIWDTLNSSCSEIQK